MAEVIVIRSGCTDYDDQHRIQGAINLPLNDRGRLQVESLVEELSGTELDVIYTSPCESARTTADAIGESLGVPVKELEGLRNLDQGLWEGLTFDEVRRKYPKVYKQWTDAPLSVCPPQGETIAEAMSRIREVLKKPCKRKDAFAVVVGEPLATLVTCVVTGERPDMGKSAKTEQQAGPVDRVRVHGKLPAQAESPTNGRANPSSNGQ